MDLKNDEYKSKHGWKRKILFLGAAERNQNIGRKAGMCKGRQHGGDRIQRNGLCKPFESVFS